MHLSMAAEGGCCKGEQVERLMVEAKHLCCHEHLNLLSFCNSSLCCHRQVPYATSLEPQNLCCHRLWAALLQAGPMCIDIPIHV
jgi:hypothetical protein